MVTKMYVCTGCLTYMHAYEVLVFARAEGDIHDCTTPLHCVYQWRELCLNSLEEVLFIQTLWRDIYLKSSGENHISTF